MGERSTHLRRLVAAGCAASLAVLIAAAPAVAKKGLGEVFIRSATVPVANNTLTVADATCPRGAPVVGGGYEAGPIGQEGPFTVGSFRVNGRSWRAAGGQGPTPHEATLTSFALCQRGARKLKPVYASVQVPPPASLETAVVEVPVSCPAGMRAVAGGFIGEADLSNGAAAPQASMRIADGTWLNSAISLGGSPATRGFTSIAYCSGKSSRSEASQMGVVTGNTGPTPTVSEVVSPPCERFLQAGGFALAKPSASTPFMVPTASRPVNTRKPVNQGWLARAVPFDSIDGSLTTFSYCR